MDKIRIGQLKTVFDQIAHHIDINHSTIGLFIGKIFGIRIG